VCFSDGVANQTVKENKKKEPGRYKGVCQKLLNCAPSKKVKKSRPSKGASALSMQKDRGRL